MGYRLWTGKPPRRRTRHPAHSPESALCAGWNEYLAKAGGINRHVVWHISPCTWSRSIRWMTGWWLASGDQRRLKGSSSAGETCSWRCAIQMAAFALLYFYFSLMGTLKPQATIDHYTAMQWLVHRPLMGGLLHLIQRGNWAGPQPAQSPRCTKCNSPPINPVYQLHIFRYGTIWLLLHSKGWTDWDETWNIWLHPGDMPPNQRL